MERPGGSFGHNSQPARRRGRPRDEAADAAIVVATLKLWAEVGFERLTVEAVAAEAGVAKTTLYRRWPSKSALAVHVAWSLARTEAVEPDTGDTRQDLVDLLSATNATYRRTVAGPILADLVGAMGTNEELAAAFRSFWSARRAVVTRVLRRGVARGEVRSDVPLQELTDLVVAPVYYRLLVTRRPLRPPQIATLVDLVMKGAAGKETAPGG